MLSGYVNLPEEISNLLVKSGTHEYVSFYNKLDELFKLKKIIFADATDNRLHIIGPCSITKVIKDDFTSISLSCHFSSAHLNGPPNEETFDAICVLTAYDNNPDYCYTSINVVEI